MCEPDMEAVFNADLARQLAVACGAAVDKASREYERATIEVHWDPASMRAVVSARHEYATEAATDSFGIGTSAGSIERRVRALATYALRVWERDNAIAVRASKEDDDIPF